MRAAVLEQFGTLAGLRHREVADPQPGPDDVVVSVRATSVSRVDLLIVDGLIKPELPRILGASGAGVVESVGDNVTGLAAGDRVAFCPEIPCWTCEQCQDGDYAACGRSKTLGVDLHGAFAERVRVAAISVVKLPPNVDFQIGAYAPVNLGVPWRMLVTKARIQPGETVLVLGAGSGVGSGAVQIAKLIGAVVYATVSSEGKEEKALALGADAVINHRSKEVVGEIKRLTGRRGVDVVFEHVGAATWGQSIACLARTGRLVTCGATTGRKAETDLAYLFAKQLQIIGSSGSTIGNVATTLALAARDKLKAVVDSTYSLSEVRAAAERLARGEQFGKIMLSI
jgi:NADPH:quinone reductase-like Zn-dependent oxidoreductase